MSKDGKSLYVFARSWNAPEVVVKDILLTPREKINSVSLLGYRGKVEWSGDGNGIKIVRPRKFKQEIPVYVFKLDIDTPVKSN